MSISSPSGARGLERLIWLKYGVMKQQNTFYLGLNTAENTHQSSYKKSPWARNWLFFLSFRFRLLTATHPDYVYLLVLW